ncbi:hypothetical protein Tco_1139671 [Tanacetum coccineum]
MEDNKEKEDLKQCFKIVQDDKVAIDAIPLATKPTPIVNFQIHRKGKQGYYEIMRVDGGQKKAIKECYEGRIVRVKRLLDNLEVTAAKVRVNAVKQNLVLYKYAISFLMDMAYTMSEHVPGQDEVSCSIGGFQPERLADDLGVTIG